MLELRSITAGYGRQPVVHGVSLTLKPGEIVALVGANGAGKSTLVKTISGLLRPHEGEILLDGRRIDRLSPRARVLGGIAHVPEGRQVFAGLTIAGYCCSASTSPPAISRADSSRCWQSPAA